jgi:hypothetical protein
MSVCAAGAQAGQIARRCDHDGARDARAITRRHIRSIASRA